ncbi:MAG TPA: anti-sigma F factor antagonist [Eubacteriaceae bacterium]|nr:anti-sigma F factor antagonist [Eubacteriaceae bacterium]
MTLELCIDKQTLLVKIIGELDHHTAEEIRNAIDFELDNNSVRNILFDFSDLTFMDSSGIGVLMGRYKKVSKRNGQVGIYHINPQVRRIFEISGLLGILKEYKNKKQALENI